MDTLGTYEIIANTSLKSENLKYIVAKVSYLTKGYNVDQEVLLWVVKDKGIYIQQENDNKKLFLLEQIQTKKGEIKNTGKLIEQIMQDTILFPLPPPLP